MSKPIILCCFECTDDCRWEIKLMQQAGFEPKITETYCDALRCIADFKDAPFHAALLNWRFSYGSCAEVAGAPEIQVDRYLERDPSDWIADRIREDHPNMPIGIRNLVKCKRYTDPKITHIGQLTDGRDDHFNAWLSTIRSRTAN